MALGVVMSRFLWNGRLGSTSMTGRLTIMTEACEAQRWRENVAAKSSVILEREDCTFRRRCTSVTHPIHPCLRQPNPRIPRIKERFDVMILRISTYKLPTYVLFSNPITKHHAMQSKEEENKGP